MISEVLQICQKASDTIMGFYKKPFSMTYKADQSPVTEADFASHKIIVAELKRLINYPVISEENNKHDNFFNAEYYWLVDPLDGTKEFIKQTGEFTVNIALVKNNEPILGVVAVPFKNDFYYAEKNKGSFKNGHKIFNSRTANEHLIVGVSRSHLDKSDEIFISKHQDKIIERMPLGSSLKFCKLAEGEIDLYYRSGPTYEWDTAAGHIIASEGGAKIMILSADGSFKNDLRYGKAELKNPGFISLRKNLKII